MTNARLGKNIAFAMKASEELWKREDEENEHKAAQSYLEAHSHFAMVTTWISQLPIKSRQKILLGRVWAFQSSGKVYFQSHVVTASELGLHPDTVRRDLRQLSREGILLKRPRGASRSAEYRIDVDTCHKLIVGESADREDHGST